MNWSSFKYLTRQGLRNMVAHRMMTLASVGVLTACLIMMGFAWLFGVNVDSLLLYLSEQNETVVYLQENASDETIAGVESNLQAMPGIVSVQFVSSAEVLETYKGYMDEYEDLWKDFEGEENPFRANFRVVLADLKEINLIVQELGEIPGVENVRAPIELSDLFIRVERVINLSSWVLVLVLGAVSLVVIGNTIRIAVFARRKEINIMKIVGATNGFIRFPFFVEGLTGGLISAAIASVVVLSIYGTLVYFSQSCSDFWRVLLGGSILPLGQVWYQILGGFLVFGSVIGSMGTASSIRRYLQV